MKTPAEWEDAGLFDPPAWSRAAAFDHEPGLTPLFYEYGSWRGRPARAFAWLGFPETPGPWPAMVLVHGGGGTAFAEWVRQWNARGYAAIAMDTCGGVPVWCANPYYRAQWPRHEHSGPAGWGDFANSGLPAREQWCWHAMAAVISGLSLLRSCPGVAPDRIGITGISWGGVLACIAAGVDPRLRFAIPVYGNGFLGDRPERQGPDYTRWLELWDPCHYLPGADIPFLWVNSTNDFAFPLDCTRKSADLGRGPSHFTILVRLPHSNEEGGVSEKRLEILNFANHILDAGPSLTPPTFGPLTSGNGIAGIAYDAAFVPVRAELNYTRGTEIAKDRWWETVPARLDTAAGRLEATAPAGVTGLYFQLFSESGLVFSSPPQFL